MKLLLNHCPYRLEQGYELGFGPSVYDTMADLILAFREPDQDILFMYTNWSRELDPHRDEMIESSASDFHANYIYDPNEAMAQRASEILLQYYNPGLNPQTHQGLRDELLTQFRETAWEELNRELLESIGSAVYDMSSRFSLEDQNEAAQDFVNSRLLYTNSTCLIPNDRAAYLKNVLWYRVNTKEEIIQSFELNEWWFACVILNADTPIEQYRYLLDYTEEHGDEHDGMVLYITPQLEDTFLNTVLPRLKELLGTQLEIIT